MSQVFISYSRADGSDYARRTASNLNSAGFTTFLDEESIHGGEEWEKALDRSLEQSSALVLILTPRALSSEYVTYEWMSAYIKEIPVFPLQFFQVEQFPYPLNKINAPPFWKEERWDRLCFDLQRAVSQPNSSRKLPFVKQALDRFDDLDKPVRQEALRRLTESKHPVVQQVLQSLVNHHFADVAIESAVKLARLTKFQNKEAYERLVAVPSNPDESEYLTTAVGVLADYADPQIADLMLDVFVNGGELAHLHASRYMTNLGMASLPYLLKAKRHWEQKEGFDTFGNRRYETILHHLSQLGGDEAISALIEAIPTNYYQFALKYLHELATPIFHDLALTLFREYIHFYDATSCELFKLNQTKTDSSSGVDPTASVIQIFNYWNERCLYLAEWMRQLNTAESVAALEQYKQIITEHRQRHNISS